MCFAARPLHTTQHGTCPLREMQLSAELPQNECCKLTNFGRTYTWAAHKKRNKIRRTAVCRTSFTSQAPHTHTGSKRIPSDSPKCYCTSDIKLLQIQTPANPFCLSSKTSVMSSAWTNQGFNSDFTNVVNVKCLLVLHTTWRM